MRTELTSIIFVAALALAHQVPARAQEPAAPKETPRQEQTPNSPPPADTDKSLAPAQGAPATGLPDEMVKKPPISPNRPGGPRKGNERALESFNPRLEFGAEDMRNLGTWYGFRMRMKDLRFGRMKALRPAQTIKGVVVRRDANGFILRSDSGSAMRFLLTDETSVVTRPPLHGSIPGLGLTHIARGANVEVVTSLFDGPARVARKVTLNPLRPVRASKRPAGWRDNMTNEAVAREEGKATIYFEAGSASLSKDAARQLEDIVRKVPKEGDFLFEVSGFASADGNPKANRRLAQQRAAAVIHRLFEDHRIPLRRIASPYGYGDSSPVADNATPEGRERNRRVEIRLLVERSEPVFSPVKR